MNVGKLFIYHVKKDAPDQDINLLITRSNLNLPRWTHISQLAPSKALIGKFTLWQVDNSLKTNWEEFKKMYLQELVKNQKSRIALSTILLRLRQGKNVSISTDLCEGKHCYLQVLAEWIEKQGYEIVQGKDIRPKRKFRLSNNDSDQPFLV
ncbi:MAG: hypothetical protein ACH0QD_01425 [Tepidibacillus sp.]